MVNCTFLSNTATTYGGGAISTCNGREPPVATNCIFWGDSGVVTGEGETGGRVFDTSGTSIVLNYCAVDGDWTLKNVSGPGEATATSMQLLTEENNPFEQEGTGHLRSPQAYNPPSAHPCVDKGLAQATPLAQPDIENQTVPWPSGGAWDIGADEYNPVSRPSTTTL
jgi:predicted outer membrane repeat protein